MISDPVNVTEQMVNTKTKRDEFIVEIRKSKNNSLIKQKRMKLYDGSLNNPLNPAIEQIEAANDQNMQEVQISPERAHQLEQLRNRFFEHSNNQNWAKVTEVVKYLREGVTAKKDNVPVGEIIKLGIIPHLLEILTDKLADQHDLQVESAWLLANLCASKTQDTDALIELGCLSVFIKCFRLANEEVHENIMWALANIASESQLHYRDEVIRLGVLEEVVGQLCKPAKRTLYNRTAVWLIQTLLRGPVYPRFQDVSSSLIVFAQLIHLNDKLTQLHTLKCVQFLTETHDEEAFREIKSYGFIHKVIKILQSRDDDLSSVALRIIGNLAYANNLDIIQVLLDQQILRMLPKFLEIRNKKLRTEACYILSNILAEKPKEKDNTIIYQIMPIIARNLNDESPEVKLESTCCIVNFTHNHPTDEVQILVSYGVIGSLLQNLSMTETKITKNSLFALKAILEHGDHFKEGFHGTNPYSAIIYQCNGQLKLEELQQHADNDVFRLVEGLIDNYFDSEEIGRN